MTTMNTRRAIVGVGVILSCVGASACSGGGGPAGGDARAADGAMEVSGDRSDATKNDAGSDGAAEVSMGIDAGDARTTDIAEDLATDARGDTPTSPAVDGAAADVLADAARDVAAGDGAVVAGARFEIRVGAKVVPADGYSWIPMLVVGTNPDGTPASDAITLSLSRANAGLLRPSSFTLEPLGNRPFFIPCSYADAGCVGTVKVRVARSGAPDVILAESEEITMAMPTGLGSAAACLVAANAFFFDGNDYIYQGTMTVTDGVFTDQSSTATHLQISVRPLLTTQGSNWRFDFSSAMLGQPLREQVYRGAERYPFEAMTKPGIDVGGSGRGCNRIAGDFEIQKLVWDNTKLRELVAVFDQHCEAGVTSLRGCIHFTAP